MAEQTGKGKSWLREVLEEEMEYVAMVQAEWDELRRTADEHLSAIRARISDVWKRFDLGDMPEMQFEMTVRKVG